MKFLIFSVFFSVHIPGTSQSFFRSNQNEKEIIKANKIVKEFVYNYTFHKEKIADSAIDISYTYNNNGDVIEQKFEKTKTTRETVTHNTFWYNTENKMIKQTSSTVTTKMFSIYEYDYDSLGNEITKYDYNEDTTRLTIERKLYNEKKQLIELWTKINADEPYKSRRYFYDEKGELSRINAYNPKGEHIYSYIYEMDETLKKKTLYLQNEDGKKVLEVCYYKGDLPIRIYKSIKSLVFFSSTTQNFDNFDQVTEYTYNPDKTIFEAITYLKSKKVKIQRHYYVKL